MKLPVTPRQGEPILDDSEVQEPRSKAARSQPESSPSSGLYPPQYAGNINQIYVNSVRYPVNDEAWEEDIESYMDAEGSVEWPPLDTENDVDEGHPPEVSPEELKIIEEAAGQEEIERLLKMKVLEDPTIEELENGSILTTRSVYDWRVREKRWKRRCRFVARECKDFCTYFLIERYKIAPVNPCPVGLEMLTSRMHFGWSVRQSCFWWNSLRGGDQNRQRTWHRREAVLETFKMLPGHAAAKWFEFLREEK